MDGEKHRLAHSETLPPPPAREGERNIVASFGRQCSKVVNGQTHIPFGQDLELAVRHDERAAWRHLAGKHPLIAV